MVNNNLEINKNTSAPKRELDEYEEDERGKKIEEEEENKR
jgi:hypothetical protein